MALRSINPATGEAMEGFDPVTDGEIEACLEQAEKASRKWATESFSARAVLLTTLATGLRNRKTDISRLISREMGKLIGEAEAEVEKCAWVCDYYAEEIEGFLADQPLASDAGRSLLAFQPLGTVLAIMPWNFPFWQLFRCAAPALASGNAVLLKHASNVPRCALTIEELFRDAGAPRGLFQTLLISGDMTEPVIADARVRGVSLTGSEVTGRKVAALAGKHLKKLVLELGGSDAFVVLDDANLDKSAEVAVQSRFLNCGQSCIAAKRFILLEAVAEDFLSVFLARVAELHTGSPLDENTTLAPMAREDLRDTLHRQVRDSIAGGAELLFGSDTLDDGPGWYYAPRVLARVGAGMPAYEEELFGPVASIILARDEEEALRLANDTRFGLGGSVWSRDTQRGEAFARRMACGSAFVNGLVKSDPRLPFGGVKDSGYGRELSLLGIREFTNAKTLWIG